MERESLRIAAVLAAVVFAAGFNFNRAASMEIRTGKRI